MENLIVIGIAIIVIIVALAIGGSLLIGALIVWPLSIILILLGGFLGGGIGALIGAGLAGAAGIVVYNNN